jgi:hypothetical protein
MNLHKRANNKAKIKKMTKKMTKINNKINNKINQKDIKRSPEEKVFIRDKRKHSSKLKIIQSDFRKINNSIPNSSDLIGNLNNKKLKSD